MIAALNFALTGIVSEPGRRFKAGKPDKKLEQLQLLDRKITDKNAELRDSLEEKKRITGQHQILESAVKSLSKRFDQFEQENSSFLQSLQVRRGKGSELDGALKRYRDQMQEFLDKKKNHYQRRDEKRKALALLQKKLVAGYSEAEEQFVPLFRDLAEHCLAVDTPEGALDIAYESRAGDMFAQFAKTGFQLVMTANINSSQLLLTLARRCGTAKMKINRMTQWAELSAVQKAEEDLFEEAYNKIESALKKGTAKARAAKGPDA